ncbi:MAG TPA: EamA family transporter, partial [Mycobacteriales bacterium]|nr:EamA family transporter [Mycobacteriales bacterium]
PRVPQTRGDRVPAPLLILVAIASVQTGSALARTVFDDLGAGGVTLLRLLLSSLLLLVVLRPRLRAWTRESWRAAIVLGAAMAGMNLVFYLSLRTVPLGVAVTVEFVGPLLLALAQTRRLVDLLWALLAAGGVVLLGVDTTSGIPLSGLGLALLAGLFWAGYILASARVGRAVPGVDGLAVALAVATLLVLPFGASGASAVFSRPALLIPALGVALLSSVISYGCELTALRRIPTRVFGILMSLEPAGAAIAGLAFLDQQLGAREVTALVLVSLASVGVTFGRRRDEVSPQPLE